MKPGIILDIETCGLNSELHFMTSFAFLEFNEKFEIVRTLQYRIPYSQQPHNRGADENTLQWRKENNVDSMELHLPVAGSCQGALRIIQEYFHGVRVRMGEFDLWARHVEFDIPFMQSYFRHFNMEIPWHYRDPCDIPSWMKAVEIVNPACDKTWLHQEVRESVAFKNDLNRLFHGEHRAHDALYDCLFDMHVIQQMYKVLQS